MGVQKEQKSMFLTAFEQREKEARSLFAAQCWYRSCLWMSLSSESSVSNKIPRYLYWSTAFTYWPPNFKTGVAVLFARLALNVMQTVLLQTIPCDSKIVHLSIGRLYVRSIHRRWGIAVEPLGKIVHLSCPGKKHISGVGMPLIAVSKTIKKFLGTSHAIF